jgi:hypothetical protein
VVDKISFANDIAPILSKYRGQMAWRLDLAKYEDVKANYQVIADQITGSPPSMPPPPFPPFPQEFVAKFQTWKDEGYAP